MEKKKLSYLETIKMIAETKKKFEEELEEKLNLTKVLNPIFVKTSTGLQDNLSGTEKAVGFEKGGEQFEIVHSLAKWKRNALGKYGFEMHTGLYTDMKAIRKDEKVDKIHSVFVEQWDWEKVINKEDRTIDYLKETVRTIYEAIKETSKYLANKYPYLDLDLPEEITFITTQELETMYPEISSFEREQIYGKEKKAIFIIGIGDKLKSGKIHDKRSPDYDDWALNGDILIYDPILDEVIEISSMGIRVDEVSLKEQLAKANCLDRMSMEYHQKILNKELPYSIGGGIGQSRLLLLLLGREHLAEVQASSWEESTLEKIKDLNVL